MITKMSEKVLILTAFDKVIYDSAQEVLGSVDVMTVLQHPETM